MQTVQGDAKFYAENAASDIIAKILSKESIRIKYGQYKTAMADVENKIIMLPMWKCSPLMKLHLRAHEVAHLLFTPITNFHAREDAHHDAIKALKVSPRVIKHYVNVVEDARIEKLICSDYPGLSKMMMYSHHEMVDLGFYNEGGAVGVPFHPSAFKLLVDRLLFTSRLGETTCSKYFQVTDDDMYWLRQIRHLKTFDDTVKLAIELYLAEIEKNPSAFEEQVRDMCCPDMEGVRGKAREIVKEIQEKAQEVLEKIEAAKPKPEAKPEPKKEPASEPAQKTEPKAIQKQESEQDSEETEAGESDASNDPADDEGQNEEASSEAGEPASESDDGEENDAGDEGDGQDSSGDSGDGESSEADDSEDGEEVDVPSSGLQGSDSNAQSSEDGESTANTDGATPTGPQSLEDLMSNLSDMIEENKNNATAPVTHFGTFQMVIPALKKHETKKLELWF